MNFAETRKGWPDGSSTRSDSWNTQPLPVSCQPGSMSQCTTNSWPIFLKLIFTFSPIRERRFSIRCWPWLGILWFGIGEQIDINEFRHVDQDSALVLRVVGKILVVASLPERRLLFCTRVNLLGHVSGRLHVG